MRGSLATVPTDAASEHDESSRQERLESRNILLLAAYQVLLRLAWVFKTESVVIPAFLHALSGQAWMQGWLPMLNRFGQSLPPLLFADRLREMPLKKRSLLRTTGLMGLVFVVIAILLGISSEPTTWWPTVFLSLYALFFVATGLNALAFNTLQGKLIRAHRRGKLMSRGGVIGSIAAIGGAWFVLQTWHADELSSFILPFAATGTGMLLAAVLALLIAEPADSSHATGTPKLRLAEQFAEAWRVIRSDQHFRRLAFCAVTFVTSQFLFPHYVPLAQEHFGTESTSLSLFLIVQNVGVGLFSILLGTLADRFGNRLALRVALVTCSLTPLLAIAFTTGLLPGGKTFFWTTFFVLGMQPVTFKTLTNYTLELTDPSKHPRYLSTLTICLAAPFLFSLPIGWLIGEIGYTPIFCGVAGIIALASLLTFSMSEPRFRSSAIPPEPLAVD